MFSLQDSCHFDIIERLGRRYLRLDPNTASDQGLDRALPLAGRSESGLFFELPVSCTNQPDDVAFTVQGPWGAQQVELRRGFQFLDLDDPDDYADEVSSSEIHAGWIVKDHIESITELLLPGRSGPRFRRVDDRYLIPYRAYQEVVWEKKSDEPPMRLIVHIADACSKLIEDLCQRPRVLLRREREKQSLDRIQQLDEGCLRWLARQPGRTIAEKAGPQQRVLGVVRQQNIDTLENRVLRDFLVRANRSSREYCAKYESWKDKSSVRYWAVRRFRSLTARLFRQTQIGGLPALPGPPVPNYVLQFDDRYDRLWAWYVRLRQQQQEGVDAMRWQQRVWAERACVAVMRSLDECCTPDMLSGEVVVGKAQRFGSYLDRHSCFASWAYSAPAGPVVVDAVFGFEVQHGPEPSQRFANLLPDLVLCAHPAFNYSKSWTLPVWCSFGNPYGDARAFRSEIEAIHADASGPGLFIIADPEGSSVIEPVLSGDWSLVVERGNGSKLLDECKAAIVRWLEKVAR